MQMKTQSIYFWMAATSLLWAIAGAAEPVKTAELWIGGATVDITPDKPVPLDGHRNLRISNKVESPITATALALESRDGDQMLDQAIIVSCDLVGHPPRHP